jgi:hypothetical protein
MSTLNTDKMFYGTVEVDNKLIDVQYKFISEDEIECINSLGFKFTTHYKSLVCNEQLKE